MSKRILDVGQCDIDHWQISQMLTKHFDVEVVRAKTHADAMQEVSNGAFDLILVNRINDADHSEGLEFLQTVKQRPESESVPVMLVSNFDDAQNAAVEAGAIRGFGKSALADSATVEQLRSVLA